MQKKRALDKGYEGGADELQDSFSPVASPILRPRLKAQDSDEFWPEQLNDRTNVSILAEPLPPAPCKEDQCKTVLLQQRKLFDKFVSGLLKEKPSAPTTSRERKRHTLLTSGACAQRNTGSSSKYSSQSKVKFQELSSALA